MSFTAPRRYGPATVNDQSHPQVGAPIRFIEFVGLTAALFALGALGIDMMLPALPALGRDLGVTDPNDRQFVISAFLAAFGAAHLVHGPLADRYGRRTVLLWSIGVYMLSNALAAVSGSFQLLLLSRVLGGFAIAATRVATTAMVRDCYRGAAMARVMSISFMVFMVVPILAPALGQAVLEVTGWRAIFWVIAGLSGLILLWFWRRMPETLAVADRRPIQVAEVLDGWRRTVSDRWSLGYSLAVAAMMGSLYGYLNSIGQVMGDTFARADLLAPVFAGTAAAMMAANLLNARIVVALGPRRVSHTALFALILVAGAHLALIRLGVDDLWTFTIFQALTMACLGLSTANFQSIAMTNMGPIAGTASSVQGFVGITAGALVGAGIGQAFDGTTGPLAAGFASAGLIALAMVLVTERGRLLGREGTRPPHRGSAGTAD